MFTYTLIQFQVGISNVLDNSNHRNPPGFRPAHGYSPLLLLRYFTCEYLQNRAYVALTIIDVAAWSWPTCVTLDARKLLNLMSLSERRDRFETLLFLLLLRTQNNGYR
jgi:hypothetical protein